MGKKDDKQRTLENTVKAIEKQFGSRCHHATGRQTRHQASRYFPGHSWHRCRAGDRGGCLGDG